jgi:hypothetical protein
MATDTSKRIPARKSDGSILAGMERPFIEGFLRLKSYKPNTPREPMKNTKQTLGRAAAVLAGSLAIASADPVVFNVNMSVQTALGYFNTNNGDTVWVLGLGSDWANGISMTQSANPDIYTVTTNLSAGTFPQYKFVIKPTSSSWIWENLPGGGNRYFQAPGVPSGGTNLPVVYFSDNTNLPSYAVQITFQVSMQFAILQGQFSQGFDYVNAFGSFDNWLQTGGVLLTNVPGTSNYVGILTTTALATNTVVSYKYAINGWGGRWEGNVGPGGAQNRSVTVTSTNQVFPLDYWNNVTNLASIPVGFQVNMAVEDAFGRFTPGSDTVFVNGDWDWSGYAVQLSQVGSSDLYTGTVALVIAPGTTVDYKYTINGLTWENAGVGPGGANNRQFVINTAINLPMDYFNNYRDLGPLFISQQGSQTTLTWPSGTNVNNRIRLQNSANLLSSWADVPNTQGQSSITNDFGVGPQFFRITGP